MSGVQRLPLVADCAFADMAVADKCGSTPLHCAARSADAHMMLWLVKHGAGVNPSATDGRGIAAIDALILGYTDRAVDEDAGGAGRLVAVIPGRPGGLDGDGDVDGYGGEQNTDGVTGRQQRRNRYSGGTLERVGTREGAASEQSLKKPIPSTQSRREGF